MSKRDCAVTCVRSAVLRQLPFRCVPPFIIVLLVGASVCFAQNKQLSQAAPETASLTNNKAKMKTTLHITSVHTEDAKDWCESDTCTAKRITVEGYTGLDATSSIEYVIECVEATAVNPETHISHVSAACPRVHAHKDYVVYVFDDGISFDLGGQQPSTPDGLVAIYDVVSEKEAPRHK